MTKFIYFLGLIRDLWSSNNRQFQKIGRKWRRMSKKLKATFSRPASDKGTKPEKEPQENPSQKSIDRIIEKRSVVEPIKKVESSKKSSELIVVVSQNISKELIVEAGIESEAEVEQGVNVDQIHLIEKKSSHHETKKTKKNSRLILNLNSTH